MMRASTDSNTRKEFQKWPAIQTCQKSAQRFPGTAIESSARPNLLHRHLHQVSANDMKNRRNFYRILHVQPDAPCEIIRASYRTLMQKLKRHPDLGGDDWNASIMNEAYTILTNPEKRAAYDRQFLHRVRTKHTQTGRQQHGREKQKPPKSGHRHDYRKDNSRCPFCGAPKPVRFRYGNSGNCNHCNSPLKPVTRLRLASKSRRAMQRTLHHTTIRYFTDAGEITGTTGNARDLSPHGMKFSSSSRLEENQVIKITSDVLSAVARVSYCHQQHGERQFTIGVELLTLHFHERKGTFISENA